MGNPFFSIQRVALSANASQPISPPRPSSAVTVLNLSGADLHVYSDLDDETTKLIVPAGWERPITLGRGQNFYPGPIAFYLKSTIDTTVELIWT